MNESLSPSLDSTCPAWLHRTKQQRQNYWGPSGESNVGFPCYDQESSQTFNMMLRTRAIRPVPQSIPPMSPKIRHPSIPVVYLLAPDGAEFPTKLGAVPASSQFVENTPSVSLHQCLVVWQFNGVEISIQNTAFQPSQVLAYCSIGLVASILGELAAGVWRVPVDLAARHHTGPELHDTPRYFGSGQTATTSRWWATLGGCGAGRGEHPRFNLCGFPTGRNMKILEVSWSHAGMVLLWFSVLLTTCLSWCWLSGCSAFFLPHLCRIATQVLNSWILLLIMGSLV